MSLQLADIPRLVDYEERAQTQGAGGRFGIQSGLTRRTLMRATAVSAIAVGLQAMQVYRPARQVLSVASADGDRVVVGGDVLRAETSPADR